VSVEPEAQKLPGVEETTVFSSEWSPVSGLFTVTE
jgi:hypothetical protein